ncbi:MAG: hypothetical protein OK455_07795 [Thaumarchaeota archaeon]|nr:hypothetical protein [Nitrososphaerota archaeon]
MQGANVLKGSAVMSGNSGYIYVGGLPDIAGLVLIIIGAMPRYRPSSTMAGGGATLTRTSSSST